MRYCSFAVGTPSLCFGFVFWQLWWEKWLTQRIPQAMLEKTPPPRHLQTAVHLGIWMYALHHLRRGSIYFVFEMIPVKSEVHFLLTI